MLIILNNTTAKIGQFQYLFDISFYISMINIHFMVRFFKLNAHDRHYEPLVERENSYQRLKCKMY